MKTPGISVVIPLYNKERQIERTIRSVLAQTFRDFELLIINDGSTDNGPSLARSFQDERVKVLDQGNRGASSARNRGISESRCELVAFLDADDEWKEDFLETVMSLSERYPECHVFATGYMYCDERGVSSFPVIKGLPDDFADGVIEDYFGISSASDPIICTSSVMVRKPALERISGFPEGAGMGEDLLTWARLASSFSLAYAKRVCATYHVNYYPRPASDDFSIVINGFQDLAADISSDKRDDFNKYVSRVHRGLAQTYLRDGQNDKARKVLRAGMSFAHSLTLLRTYYFLSWLPAVISKGFLAALMTARRLRRSMMSRTGKVNRDTVENSLR